MKLKIISLVILIVIVLASSGCVDERNLQEGVKYPILSAQTKSREASITYLDGNLIQQIPVYLYHNYTEVPNPPYVYTSGNIVIGNESYLIVTKTIKKSKYYDVYQHDEIYTEIHLTKEDLKKYSGD